MTSPQLQAALFRIVSMLLELIAFGMIAAWIWAGSRLLRGRRGRGFGLRFSRDLPRRT